MSISWHFLWIRHALIVCVVLAGWTALALAQEGTGILLDASGSMKGFFTTETIHALYEQINAAIDGPKYGYYFKYSGQGGGIEPYARQYRSDGKITLIDRAYEDIRGKHPTLGALWLITDNIQDPEGHAEEQGDINRFYNKLKHSQVKRVHIFPTTRDFNGPVYGRDGKTKVADYSGPRGVIIYAILFNQSQEEAFTDSVQRFSKSLGEPGILVKPLDATIRQGTGQQRAIEQLLAKEEEDFTVKADEGNAAILVSRKVFSLGASHPIEGTFVVRFTSHLENVQIDRSAEVRVPQTPFQLQGVPTVNPEIRPQPVQLAQPLLPGERSGDIRVHIRFPKGLSTEETGQCAWQSTQPGRYTGSVRVSLGVKKSQLSLVDKVRKKYSTKDPKYFTTPNPEYQSLIFGLEDLFREPSPEEFETSLKTYQVTFHLICPVPSYVWQWIAALLGGLVLLGSLGFLLTRSPDYRLASQGGGSFHFWCQRALQQSRQLPHSPDDNDIYSDYTHATDEPLEAGEVVRLPFLSFGRGHLVTLNGSTAAKIQRSWRQVYVKAEPGFTMDDGRRQLGLSPTPIGTTFHLTQDENTGPVPPPKPSSSRGDAFRKGTASPLDTYDDYPE